ncbi:E3 ubiquitin-protein ligase RSL1-like isoform X1 [Capsicum annuum]|uniref:E3 ubiquitin-protein ligase RSL1-like isoform X1 n=2 Tax=Capsicum annuum TaxID=4072 RepID=UPI0007BF908F|nr:E3 ubiquitin-protein ligase RSL1-like isoform X1 [Capsicum annuum]
MVDFIDITEDNDDFSVKYSTPKSSKGEGKIFIESISVEKIGKFSKPSSSGTKKLMVDLSEDSSDDEIHYWDTKCVKNSKYKSIYIGDDKVHDNSFTCDIHVDGEIKFLGSNISKIKSIFIDDDDVDHGKFTCDICYDEKSINEIFKIMGCSHSYCKECMAKYLGTKIQENISRISCPNVGCKGILEPYNCRSILPKHVFDRWGDALCEAMILGSEKFYCPFKDCSALLIDENGGDFVVTQSECPECRRLFCAKCKVGWHSGIVCEEFQKLNENERGKEDLQLMQLAKSQEWQRCPRCKFYVARTNGCAQMKCRCGCYFCYKCGAESSNHYCKSCGTLDRL